jgi:hypothetical protein
MMNRQDFIVPVQNALKAHGGRATLVQVCRHVWEHHERDIRKSGDLFYTWQYEVRHAASLLGKAGVKRSADASPRGVWELA